MPRFQPGVCSACRFIGTFYEHDIYFCDKEKNSPGHSSIIARFGDEGDQCSSCPISILLKKCEESIRLVEGDGMDTMSYQDYVFSAYCSPAERAMIMALAIDRMKALV